MKSVEAMWMAHRLSIYSKPTLVSQWKLPSSPIKAPLRLKTEHTPHFEDSTCKAPSLSVVARHRLVGRVARL
jgi:hypothetical protein